MSRRKSISMKISPTNEWNIKVVRLPTLKSMKPNQPYHYDIDTRRDNVSYFEPHEAYRKSDSVEMFCNRRIDFSFPRALLPHLHKKYEQRFDELWCNKENVSVRDKRFSLVRHHPTGVTAAGISISPKNQTCVTICC